MASVMTCISGKHDLYILFWSGLIAVFGSILTMNLFGRARKTRQISRYLWGIVCGIVGGSSVWSTHFLSMVAFDPGLDHAYNSWYASLTLGLAICTTTVGMIVAAEGKRTYQVEFGGLIVGGGIALMHFVGMEGYRVEGTLTYDIPTASAAVLLGMFFGALSVNRIARPSTRFCKYGGALAFLLSIVTLHFVAMSAITIIPDSSIVVSPQALTNDEVVKMVLTRIVFVLGLGLMAYMLDHYKNQEVLARYRHLALHDPLTALPNRTYLADELKRVLSRRDDKTAVLTFDFNRFKDINDVHSHAAGDRVLQTVATRLSAILEEGEFMARVGGDEFVAYKEGLRNRGQALAFAKRIKTAVTAEVRYEDKNLSVGSSIGIAMFPHDGQEVDDLIGKADLAMYRAKRSSQAGIEFYEVEKDEANRDRSALSIDIRHAIERNEFELHFQPQNRVSDRALIGFEVLLRWNHPERGMVGPETFIPIAERDGYVNVIGEWVLREACLQAVKWKRPTKIAVNVSASQLVGTRLTDTVKSALKESGLSPSLLEIELTESGIIADYNHAMGVVEELKAIGISIALDDFGTGFSSLSTLQAFPFDKIKIDKSFVLGIENDKKQENLLRSIIQLGDTLNIMVLAEGVETEQQFRFLEKEKCLQVQGFLFGRPTADVEGFKDVSFKPAENKVVRLRG